MSGCDASNKPPTFTNFFAHRIGGGGYIELKEMLANADYCLPPHCCSTTSTSSPMG